MSLTREDVLKELELWPIWRLNASQPILQAPIIAEPEQKVVESMIDEVATTPEVDDIVSLTIDIPVAPQSLILKPWVIYCPQAEDDDSQTLLTNIVKAMQLAPDEMVLVQSPEALLQYQTQKMVLFGLDAANTYLHTHHQDIQQVRGQCLLHEDVTYVVTHHPREMLSKPLLKREVWQDLCLLLQR